MPDEIPPLGNSLSDRIADSNRAKALDNDLVDCVHESSKDPFSQRNFSVLVYEVYRRFPLSYWLPEIVASRSEDYPND